jgi:hypothetical protein
MTVGNILWLYDSEMEVIKSKLPSLTAGTCFNSKSVAYSSLLGIRFSFS